MMMAPERNSSEVPITEPGDAIGAAMGAAINVEKRQGKKR
jgi:hypothetical protein